MKKYIIIVLILLISTSSFAAQGKVSGTVKDWVGQPVLNIAVKVYVYYLTGSDTSKHLDVADKGYVASTTTDTSGVWSISSDVDIVLGTEYFIVYFWGGSYIGADGNSKSNLLGTSFQTAVAP